MSQLVIGTFTPAPKLEEDFDMEEADRVLREEGHLGITTEDLMAHLRALGKESQRALRSQCR